MLPPSVHLQILRWLVVFFLFARGYARQQCRLVPKLDVQLGGDHPQLPLSANPTASTQDASSQPSQTGSAMPSTTPFNYGKDVIRGVNL